MKSDKILVIIMNYFNEDEVILFIENQLLACHWPDMEVMVVVNGAMDKVKLDNLGRAHREVMVVNPGTNTGYLPGAKFGYDQYLADGNPVPRSVIISNSDLEIIDKAMFKKLPEIIGNGGFDILGPDVTSALTGEHLNPYIPRRIRKLKMKVILFFSMNFVLYNLFLFFTYLKHIVLHSLQLAGRHTGVRKQTYGIHGSFMVFARSFFEKGGSFSYPLKLFGEEIWFGEMALRLGMSVVYDPSITLIHHEHSSTGMFKDRKSVKTLHESYEYLFREYFSG